MKHILRNLWLVLFLAGLFLGTAQQGNQKSEVLQDIKELKNDIKELEAELADAKINYPEDVPELQKDLAATKKMLASFEKMAGVSTQSKPAVAKVNPPSIPTNNSSIVPIVLSKPVSAPLPGEDKDRLLWYKGKKINDSTLITTNAMLVQHQKKKNRVVVQPDKNSDQFKKMIEELGKNEQRKDQLIDKFVAMKNGPLYYQELERSLEIYDDYASRYNEVLKNTIDLPPMSGATNLGGKTTGGNSILAEPDIMMKYVSLTFDPLEQLKLAKKMFDELPPLQDFPAPPEHDMGVCGSCDENIIEKEKKADAEWYEKYFGKEAEVIRTALGAYRQLVLLSIDINGFERENGVDLSKYIDPISDRMDKKNELLVKKYGKDFKRKTIVAQAVLGVERQKALLGLGNESGSNAISAITEMFSEKEFVDYFKEQASARNYNFVLNCPFFLGLERQKALLGVESEASGKNGLGKLFDMFVDCNRFNLTLDLDFIYKQIDPERDGDKTEMKATGTIYTKDKVYVFLFREKCTWKIGLGELDFKNANEKNTSLPLTVRSGYKTIRNEEDELVTYQYSGNKELFAQFPSFSIDLCNVTKKDSVYMMPLNYATDVSMGSPDALALSIKMGDTEALSKTNKSYKEELLPIANHMFINVPKDENILDDLSNMASDIFNWLSGSTITKPTGNPKMDDMQEKFNQKQFQEKAKTDISKKAMNKEATLLFDAQNGQAILVDKERDTKHEIDEFTELEKGIIHLKIIHDPVTSN